MKISLKPSTMPEENLGPVSIQSLQPLLKKNGGRIRLLFYIDRFEANAASFRVFMCFSTS